MLAKLSLRNMKRSAKDYMTYTLTMTIVFTLMYAFNSLIFQDELSDLLGQEKVMGMMIVLATVFILLIVAWLINYMVRFMLEKRSTEFGIYLLLGMSKKTVSRLYMRENMLLGGFSFLIGHAAGLLLQQVLTTVMFSMMHMEYRLHISFSPATSFMTLLCYMGCYLLALLRCKRKFHKMNIHSLMNAKKQNEESKENQEKIKQIFFPLSILFILAFWTLFGRIGNTWQLAAFLVGLVISIYLFYMGLSAWIVCYIRKKGNGIYKGLRLFLLRQFASKVRTMQFTMGTLTALFTLALMGSSVAFMFNEYENTVLNGKFPFDIQIYGSASDHFEDDRAVIESSAEVKEFYSYHIYTDKGNQVNTWMLTHLTAWGTMYQNPDGTPDRSAIEKMLKEDGVYYPYDTYMGISDYNHLRKLLGYPEVSLPPGQYLLQVKPRLESEVQTARTELILKNEITGDTLSCAGIIAEPFSQDGHNGADYIIIVTDETADRMEPYYSELVAAVDGNVPSDLCRRLDTLTDGDEKDIFGHSYENICAGSDNIIVMAAVNLVRNNLIMETKYMLASLIIPLFYVGLVFVCIAVTVLSIQQLSDSAKYRFRYEVLDKLGIGKSRQSLLLLKQLTAYYLCPAILALIISGKMILFMSRRFVLATGVPANSGKFFLESALFFLGIYIVYFFVTYIGFQRNLEEKAR